MDSIRSKAIEFLKTYGMYPGDIDIAGLCGAFEDEMRDGLSSSNSSSSLMMIPTYIKLEENIPARKPVIVIDAGGTNFRAAVVSFDDSRNCVIDDFNNYPMPGSYGEITKEAFFGAIYGYIEPLLDKGGQIGLCFSYPTDIQPNRDGRVLAMSKEIKVAGLIGELVNKGIQDAIRSKRGESAVKPIVQLNDTVATLLGGKAAFPNRAFDGYVGLILGTGTNTCYAEDIANIRKLGAPAPGGDAMLINIESGNFGKAPRGPIDESLDSKTNDRGKYLFEKAVSGAYQGPLLAEIAKRAAADGIFGGGGAAGRLAAIGQLTSKEIDDFLYYPGGDNALANCCRGDGNAALALYWLIDAMLERAAIFAAANVSAILRKTGRGKNPNLPVCVTADGTTFYKSKLLRPKLDYHIRAFTNERLGLYCEFVKAPNAVLAGTAIAALQNS
ncbi:MAG: hexokinase [Clostridiales bacterium]|jgi:hexokinase|nr:hexokinase [Clostridiales bacterium]